LSTLAASWWRPNGLQPLAIAAGALSLAIVVGVALAVQLPLGVALVLAVFYGLVLLFAPVWALVAFVPLIFLEALPALNLGGKAAGLLVAASWIGAAMSGRVDLGRMVRRHRRLFECLVALLVWLCLSSLWASQPGATLGDMWHWVSVALLFAIVATWVTDERILIWICAAFVLGAVFAVIIGLGTGMVEAGGAGAEARLEGGSGDPNFLAAGLVPAMVLAAGILVAIKSPLGRLGCVVAILICAFGVAATQSRGGFLALLVVLVAALVVFRRRRIYVALACLAVVALGAAYFSVTPTAWERISQIGGDDGSGRTDLWKVAWRAAEDHPLEGVGLGNYEFVAKNYTRLPGALKDVNKIAEKPHVVHNTYLEALAETGIVGLALFLVLAGGSCYAAWSAGRRFEELDDHGMEALSRAVVVATIGMLVSAFFISSGVDKRMWILFALGPASLAIAEGRNRYRAP
jgi:MYXO-CTERM domain-containing protein